MKPSSSINSNFLLSAMIMMMMVASTNASAVLVAQIGVPVSAPSANTTWTAFASAAPTSAAPTSAVPTSAAPTSSSPTSFPTLAPTTLSPTGSFTPTSLSGDSMMSSACYLNIPDNSCGIETYPDTPCPELISSYIWSGSCCSFTDLDGGAGCTLNVDGPGSVCTWKELHQESYYNIFIGTGSGYCPESQYEVEGVKRRSNYNACVTFYLQYCFSTCTSYSQVHRTLNNCITQNVTEALICTDLAVSTCSAEKGRAPRFVCSNLESLYASGLGTESCSDLKDKCRLNATDAPLCT